MNLKCHICNSDLIESHIIWRLGSRRYSDWECHNNSCLVECNPNFTSRHIVGCIIGLISPENELINYSVMIYKNNKLFKIESHKRDNLDSTVLYYCKDINYVFNSVCLEMKRFYPIDLNAHLTPQIDNIFNKLKTLVIFK